jgi:hypothetical protein
MAFTYLEVRSMSDEETGFFVEGEEVPDLLSTATAGGKPPIQGGGEPDGPEVGFADSYLVDREELLVLARHWYKSFLDTEYFEFWSASSEWKQKYWDGRRFGRIAKMLGEVEKDKIIQEVRAELRESLGEEEWRVFMTGTKAEVARVQEEAMRGIDALQAKKADEGTCRAAHAYLGAHPTGVFFDGQGDMWYLGRPRACTPAGPDPNPGRLILRVRTRRGTCCWMPAYTVERPPGWSAPFGLR